MRNLLWFAFFLAVNVSGATSSERDWQEFRAGHPFHIQTVAITSPSADGSRTLIIAEPPPHVSAKSLADLDPKRLSQIEFPKHKIGFDGFVRDAVASLPAMPEEELRELLDRIHFQMFGTTYKTNALLLPAKAELRSSVPLDLRVSSEDLHRWLVKQGTRFRAIGSATAAPVEKLISNKSEGVFLSEQPGLVLWIIPRSGSLAKYRREVRQFAVDSDLIIGAISSATHTAIIARERVLPLNVLPPLRTETVLLLADVRADSLSQSYERNYLLAGKFDGRRDWAPIYLSDILIDTEYGSLLNITDQLLKSWSMAGQVKYVDFSYPEPGSFPFAKPLALMPSVKAALDKGGEGLTFNWNTKGAGYVDAADSTRIYSVNRTGALPVSYLTEGTNSSEFEKKGYYWFAEKTFDPNLARVVQYAAIYQIFREFRIYGGLAPPVPARQTKTSALGEVITSELMNFREKRCNGDLVPEFGGRSRKGLSPEIAAILGLSGSARKSCEALSILYERFGDSGINAFAAKLSEGGRSQDDISALNRYYEVPKASKQVYEQSLTTAQLKRIFATHFALELQADQFFRSELRMRIPLLKARDLFVAGAARPDRGWIRTPAIVISWPLGELASGTGGHNLDAKVSRFRQSDALAPGEIRVIEEGKNRVVLYSPADRQRVAQWARHAAVERDPIALTRTLKQSLPVPMEVPKNREFADALSLPRIARTARGNDPQLAGSGAFELQGWGQTVRATAGETATSSALRGQPARVLSVERNTEGFYRVMESESGQVWQARSMTDVMDNVVFTLKRSPSPPPVKLMLAGFSEPDAVNFRRTTEIWMKREGSVKPKGTTTLVKTTPEKGLGRLIETADVRRASFSEWKSTEAILPSGIRGRLFETTIEIPPKVGGIGGVWIRVKLWAKTASTKTLAAVELKFKALLGRMPQETTVEGAAAALEKELRLMFPDAEAVTFELEDMIIVENRSNGESYGIDAD